MIRIMLTLYSVGYLIRIISSIQKPLFAWDMLCGYTVATSIQD